MISSVNPASAVEPPSEYRSSEQAGSNNGTIKGNVVNTKLFVVPNATATLVSSTGFTYTTTSDAEGAFIFNNVPPGSYTLRVSQPAYPPYETQNLIVKSGQVTSVYVELKGSAPKTGMKNKGLIIGVIAGAGAAVGIGLAVALHNGSKSSVSPSTVP